MATELNSNISKMFSQLDGFISTKTVVGEPIKAGDVTIIPLVDVSFGVGGGSLGVTGSSEENAKNAKDEKSLGGLGANIKPSAVLVISGDDVQLVNIKHQDSVNKLIDLIPSITSKFDLKSLFGKKKDDKKDSEDNFIEEVVSED